MNGDGLSNALDVVEGLAAALVEFRSARQKPQPESILLNPSKLYVCSPECAIRVSHAHLTLLRYSRPHLELRSARMDSLWSSSPQSASSRFSPMTSTYNLIHKAVACNAEYISRMDLMVPIPQSANSRVSPTTSTCCAKLRYLIQTKYPTGHQANTDSHCVCKSQTASVLELWSL